MRREIFVTTGATADFRDLVANAVSDETLKTLADLSFTHLTIQGGKLGDYYESIKPKDTKGINIRFFDFNKNGLHQEMRACQAKKGASEEGLVVCHAGKNHSQLLLNRSNAIQGPVRFLTPCG
jgi:UDP-N-acetylglucosamine transferase subunit ALG13